MLFQGDGFHFLKVGKDGSTSAVENVHTGHGEISRMHLMKNHINAITNNTIVLMSLCKTDHKPESQTFLDVLIPSLQSIGSSITQYSQIADKIGWALIGYKGDRKSWITESVDDDGTGKVVITKSINPIE